MKFDAIPPEISVTQETYAQIAADYAIAWKDRSLLQKHITRFAQMVKPGGRVVDVGCGPGFDAQHLAKLGLRLTGVDLAPQMMLAGRDDHGVAVDFVCADMRHLPLRGDFDGVWASASLLHLPRQDAVPTLCRFRRLVREEAVLFITVKLGAGQNWVCGAYGHDLSRFYSFWKPEELDAALMAGGWQPVDGGVEESTHAHWLVRLARPLLISGAT